MSGVYRAWCLSWEQDEADGVELRPYDPFTHDYSRRDRGVCWVNSVNLCDAEDAAEAAADYYHSQRDAWDSSWPLTFRVRGPDGITHDFEVERDTVPTFHASFVRKSATP